MIAALLLTAAMQAATAAAPARGTLRRYEIDAPELHDPQRSVRVYTPAGYDDTAAAGRRYPVIYLLHGWPGSEGNWPGMGRATVTADSLIASGRIPPVLLVFPNGSGNGFLGRSLWIDSYDGSSRLETFLTHRLVPWVDSTFRTLRSPERRAVVGLSDGGTAAINLVLQHPELFDACGSHSADLRLERGMGMGGVIGPEPGATKLLESHSPLVYAPEVLSHLDAPEVLPHLDPPLIYFDCGADDESVAQNREFDAMLTKLGIPHDYHEYPGTHDWKYWRTHLPASLEAVTARMHDE
jgi:enterochelin esterase-like enzyme